MQAGTRRSTDFRGTNISLYITRNLRVINSTNVLSIGELSLYPCPEVSPDQQKWLMMELYGNKTKRVRSFTLGSTTHQNLH